MASSEGLNVAYEFHGNTLNDTNTASKRLLEEVGNIKTYWQPTRGKSTEYCLTGIETLKPWLANIHIFNFGEKGNRKLLADDSTKIKKYLDRANEKNIVRSVLIEFVKDDLPENFLKDAETLLKLTC